MIKKATHAKYDLSIDSIKKVFMAEVRGFYKPEDAEAFLSDYNKVVNGINAKDYHFVLECDELKTSSKEMIPILKGCYELYKSTGFKKVYIIKPSSPISLMQLKKVGEETGLDVEYVDKFPF